jgi:hypothetical protein
MALVKPGIYGAVFFGEAVTLASIVVVLVTASVVDTDGAVVLDAVYAELEYRFINEAAPH